MYSKFTLSESGNTHHLFHIGKLLIDCWYGKYVNFWGVYSEHREVAIYLGHHNIVLQWV